MLFFGGETTRVDADDGRGGGVGARGGDFVADVFLLGGIVGEDV